MSHSIRLGSLFSLGNIAKNITGSKQTIQITFALKTCNELIISDVRRRDNNDFEDDTVAKSRQTHNPIILNLTEIAQGNIKKLNLALFS